MCNDRREGEARLCQNCLACEIKCGFSVRTMLRFTVSYIAVPTEHALRFQIKSVLYLYRSRLCSELL